MSKKNENPQRDHNDNDAVSLFAQFTSGDDSRPDSDDTDSTSDLDVGSDEDEQLDQEDADEELTDSEDEEVGGDEEPDEDDGESSDEDPWAAAPESLRNEYMSLRQDHQKLSNEHRANSGRVAALNRELNTLREQMKASEKAGGKSGKDSDQPTADDLKGKSFAQVEEEWPEIAAYLKYMVKQANDTVDQKLTPVEQWKQEVEQERQQHALQTEYEKLAQAHPDYQDIANDPAFRSWLQSQSPGVQAMGNSTLADDNITLLNLYKSANSRNSSQSTDTPPKPAARKKSLSDHAEIPRKGAGRAADSESTDPVQLFNQLVTKKS